jgi:hypothetical protein
MLASPLLSLSCSKPQLENVSSLESSTFVSQPGSLVTVLAARWCLGRFELIEEISQTDEFRDPSKYLGDGYQRLYNEQWKKI